MNQNVEINKQNYFLHICPSICGGVIIEAHLRLKVALESFDEKRLTLFYIKVLERIMITKIESNNFLHICLSRWWWCDDWATFDKVALESFDEKHFTLFHIKLLERILLKQTESNNFLYICLSPWWWCDNWAAFAKVAHKPFAILTNKCDIDTEVLTVKIPQQTQSIYLVYICI